MPEQDFEIPQDILEGWAGVAHTARLMIDVLQQIRDPKPGSNLAQANDVYAPERGSDWCRGYLTSALEHLEFWGDHVAPLKFHPEQRVRHTFRPVQTLSRAAIESSAHAIWVLDARTAQECTRRHLSLVVHDSEEQKKAAVGQERKTALARRREDLVRRIGPDFSEDDVKRVPGYMDLVKQAAAVVAVKGSATYDIDTVERLWQQDQRTANAGLHMSCRLLFLMMRSFPVSSVPCRCLTHQPLPPSKLVTDFQRESHVVPISDPL